MPCFFSLQVKTNCNIIVTSRACCPVAGLGDKSLYMGVNMYNPFGPWSNNVNAIADTVSEWLRSWFWKPISHSTWNKIVFGNYQSTLAKPIRSQEHFVPTSYMPDWQNCFWQLPINTGKTTMAKPIQILFRIYIIWPKKCSHVEWLNGSIPANETFWFKNHWILWVQSS